MDLNQRYSRQIALDDIGVQGQSKLQFANLAVIGCGGLGAIAAAYLAGAGVGNIILVDADIPNVSNIHRQVFFDGNETESKSYVLQQKLKALNPEIEISSFTEYLTKNNIDDILTGTDLVLECTDDIMCKYLVNDFCAMENIPLAYGAIHKTEGYVSLFRNKAESDIHLRDIFPQPDLNIPTCAEVGVYNIIAGIIGLLQANEALKYLLGIGEPLVGKLLTYEALRSRQFTLSLKKTFSEEIENIYDNSTYENIECGNVPEISVEQLMKLRESYTLFSVMKKEEHQSIDSETTWTAHDDINETIKNLGNEDVVLYCRVGRVSRIIASELIDTFPSKNIFSLKGGYVAYQKAKM